MGRKAGTEVGVNSCLVAFIATESVSIALSWLLLPPEVGVNRHGQKQKTISVHAETNEYLMSALMFTLQLVYI